METGLDPLTFGPRRSKVKEKQSYCSPSDQRRSSGSGCATVGAQWSVGQDKVPLHWIDSCSFLSRISVARGGAVDL
jgi:hypothetical protein